MISKVGLYLLVIFLTIGWELGFLTHAYIAPRRILAQDEVIAPVFEPVGLPQSIIISSLNIRTAIESVGSVDGVRMDVPKSPNDVAWYNIGAKPGEVGNVVIDGHYDTDTGDPAIFYTLKNIHSNDTIQIIDTYNNIHIYTVTNVESFSNENFPFARVFGKSHRSQLFLITCDGVWNKADQNYSKRFIVTAELKN